MCFFGRDVIIKSYLPRLPGGGRDEGGEWGRSLAGFQLVA